LEDVGGPKLFILMVIFPKKYPGVGVAHDPSFECFITFMNDQRLFEASNEMIFCVVFSKVRHLYSFCLQCADSLRGGCHVVTVCKRPKAGAMRDDHNEWAGQKESLHGELSPRTSEKKQGESTRKKSASPEGGEFGGDFGPGRRFCLENNDDQECPQSGEENTRELDADGLCAASNRKTSAN